MVLELRGEQPQNNTTSHVAMGWTTRANGSTLPDHGNRQGQFIGQVIGLTALACAFVLARMYTRAVLVRSLGPGEFIVIIHLSTRS